MKDGNAAANSPAFGYPAWGNIAALLGFAICSIWLVVSSDAAFRGLLYTTISLAAQVTLITLPAAAIIALLLTRTNIPGGRAWPIVCVAPIALPSFVLIAGWDAVIGPIGWAKQWLPMDTALSTVRWWSAVLLHWLLALPCVVLLFSLGFSRVEAELEETALLFWSWPRVLLAVTLRRAAPLFLAAAAWIIVSVSGEIAVTDIYQIRTLAEELYLDYQTAEFHGLAAYTTLLGLTAFVAVALAERSLRTDAVMAARNVRRFSLGAAKWPAALLLAGLFLVLVLTPLASLIYKAGLHVQQYDSGHPFQTWTLGDSLETLAAAPRQFAPELSWTFQYALLAGVVAMLIGLAMTWTERIRPTLTPLNSLCIVISIALPGPLVAIGCLRALSNLGAPGVFLRDRTLFALIIVSAFRALPWIVLILRHAFRTLSEEQIQLARLQGWGALRILFSVAIPQRWPLLASAAIFSIALSVSEVASSLLLVPPGVELASVRMMGMLHSGVDNQLAGLALLLIGGYVLGLLLLAYLLRAAERRV